MGLFINYFNQLNNTKINYAITGRTENYPDHVHSDIDIVIPHDQLNDFWSYMDNLRNNGLKWIQVISHESTAHYCIITLKQNDKHELIKPDVCTDYYRKGTLFLKADYLLENKVYNDKGFYQLAPDKEFVYYLLKKIDKGSMNLEQFSHLINQWKRDRKGCLESISSFFSLKNKELIEKIFDLEDFDLALKEIAILGKDLRGQLKFSIADKFKKIKNRIQRIFNPTGLIVAFMGPDGAGKTTVINGVKDFMTDTFRQNKQYHLFPKEGDNSNVTTDPHAQVPRGFIMSLLKLIYFIFLYQKGFWFEVLPLKIKSTFVIFDRYFHDQIVDPRRYRHGISLFWIKFVGIFIPKPDIWILVNASPDIIQQRKSEVSPEETERQVKEYKKLFGKLNSSFIVNGDQSPEMVSKEAIDIIIKYLENRNNKRFKAKLF